ncbi:hypothetical protein RB4243 [Rhodopirellula baltica SH 1]|uniref:Uncharacterized protein n=1 Tax=Rhodopirellula baltica (strain DSM 10527 / NCIMB 13988 / SH1) TaxID=243090 RepID=Q7USX8_RHOBA|nr:hypothetical protein RB4243 [Rhodopirellula baltica SH 1]
MGTIGHEQILMADISVSLTIAARFPFVTENSEFLDSCSQNGGFRGQNPEHWWQTSSLV